MNKTFFKSFFFMGLVACMFSCKDDDSPLDGGNTPQGVNVRFDYSQAKLGRSQGSSATLNGSSDADWTIEVEDDDFFSVEPMSGTAGDFTLTVTANKGNTSTEKVYSKFIFNASGRKYPVTVIHLEDEIRLEPSYEAETVFSFDQEGNLLSPDLNVKAFTATSNIEWTVKTVNEADSWINVGPEVGEKGENLPIDVNVEKNQFAKERTGKFEVRVPEGTSFQYTVTQAAAALNYAIKDGGSELNNQTGVTGLDGAGETHTITLLANADWTITPANDAAWLKFEPSAGEASLEPVEVKVIVEPNDDMNAGREASFTVTFSDKSATALKISVQQDKGEMPEEVGKLKELETELEGNNAGALNWSEEADYNKWTGVKFEAGKLVELSLASKGLNGYIPAAIGQFTSLRVLDLSNNDLKATLSLEDVTHPDGTKAYTPAIPVEIKNLKELKSFKLSGNNISGTFPSDLVNHPHYRDWAAMQNIYPQKGDNADISYDATKAVRYTGPDPSTWKLKLTQVGILRAMYHAMGGENWKGYNADGSDIAWLNEEVVLAKGQAGINAVNATGVVTDFKLDASGSTVGGQIPEECLMNKSLAKFQVNNTANCGFALTGSIHPLILQRLKYLSFNNHSFDMDINFILSNLNNKVVNVLFQNSKAIDGEINTDYLKVDGTIQAGKLNFAGTSITGTVKVDDIKSAFKEADQSKVTVEEMKKYFPSTVILQ